MPCQLAAKRILAASVGKAGQSDRTGRATARGMNDAGVLDAGVYDAGVRRLSADADAKG